MTTANKPLIVAVTIDAELKTDQWALQFAVANLSPAIPNIVFRIRPAGCRVSDLLSMCCSTMGNYTVDGHTIDTSRDYFTFTLGHCQVRLPRATLVGEQIAHRITEAVILGLPFAPEELSKQPEDPYAPDASIIGTGA